MAIIKAFVRREGLRTASGEVEQTVAKLTQLARPAETTQELAPLVGTRTSPPLKSWAEQIAARRGQRLAVVALARRPAGILYAMWRDGTAYRSRPVERAA